MKIQEYFSGTITEMKVSTDYQQVESGKRKVSELEDKSVETIQSKEESKKRLNKNEQGIV